MLERGVKLVGEVPVGLESQRILAIDPHQDHRVRVDVPDVEITVLLRVVQAPVVDAGERGDALEELM